MSDQTQAPVPDFETAITELEAIVSQLESGRLPLAQSVSVYQRGAELLQRCQQTLAEAEQQIRILTESGHLTGFNPKNESTE